MNYLQLKIKSAAVLIVSFLTLMACVNNNSANETIELDPNKLFDNSIGVFSNSGQFNKLDRAGLNNFIKTDLGLTFSKHNIEFRDFELIEGEEANNRIYFLKSQSTDKSVSISIKLRYDQAGYLILTKDTCKCESTDCPDGCIASGADTTCNCSSCDQTCKKTSTSEG